MTGYEERLRSLDVFEAHKKHRLRGKDLSQARSAGYNLLVAYEDNAVAFDTVVSYVGRTITGAHLTTLSVREPLSGQSFYLSLKSRRGVVSSGELEDTQFEEFGEPKEAVLHENLGPDQEVEAQFSDRDEQRFHTLYGIHNKRMISMRSGAFGTLPQTPGRPHGR